MSAFLVVTQSLLCVLVVVLVLMHSGKDAGLSGAFGVGGSSGYGGSSAIVERNLTRITVVVSVLLLLNIWALARVL